MRSSLGLPTPVGHKRCGARAQTGRGQEAMAQWQRVGFQTQRLGVRIPLASHHFWPIFSPRTGKNKNPLPKLGIAPRLPRPQRGVLLLDYFGVWRIRVSIPVLNLAKVVCYHVQQSPNQTASIGTRTRILSLEGINTTLVLWTLVTIVFLKTLT